MKKGSPRWLPLCCNQLSLSPAVETVIADVAIIAVHVLPIAVDVAILVPQLRALLLSLPVVAVAFCAPELLAIACDLLLIVSDIAIVGATVVVVAARILPLLIVTPPVSIAIPVVVFCHQASSAYNSHKKNAQYSPFHCDFLQCPGPAGGLTDTNPHRGNSCAIV
jgi:hypothetical protein